MAKSKVINWTIVTAFLALNLVGFGLSAKRRQAEAATQRWLMELKGRQGDVLARWHAADSIPIESALCKGAIRDMQLKYDPSGNADGSYTELDDRQADKLADAIHDLASAYRRGTARALMKYMGSRGEKLNPIDVAKFTSYLVEKHGLDSSELEALNLEQQFVTFWDAYGISPEWKAVVPKESSVHVWTCHSESSESISEPSQMDGVTAELWQRRGVRHHNFENTDDTAEMNLAMHGNVTIADVRLVIQHTGEGVHTICPYTVRFWYSQQRQDWIPHLLFQFRTSRDIPEEVLF